MMTLGLWAALSWAQEPAIVAGPQIATYVEAPYPAVALALGLEATVTLRVTLDGLGVVTDVVVVSAVGHGFDEAAVAAVRQMRFTPAMTEDGPVPVVFDFAYGFALAEEVVDAPLPVRIEGVVREKATRRLVVGATVAILGGEIVGTTDSDGRFELRGVPNGPVVLRVVDALHVTADVEVEVVDGEVAVAEVWLVPTAWRENEVVATYEGETTEVTRRSVSIAEVRRIPGTFGDPLKVIQTLPGAARTPFGTGLLVIRGSNPEDSGVYVDGIRIPIIYHLTGTTSVLSPDLIQSVDYLPGGYGVQYGRSMGGVVDVRTKSEFDEGGRISFGADILDSQVMFEKQVGKEGHKHGLAIGARRSYIDLFIPFFTGDTGFIVKPRYWDYQIKWVPPTQKDRRASLFLYGFDDVLEISTPEDVAQGSDQDTQGDFRTQYNTHRLVGQWGRPLSDTLRLDGTAALGVDTAYLGLGQEFTLSNLQLLGELRAEMPFSPTPHISFVPGVDFLGGSWGFDFSSAVKITDFDDPLKEREGVSFDGSGSFWSPDPWMRLDLRPLTDADRWLLSPGLRFNAITLVANGAITGGSDVVTTTTTSFDPRLLTRYTVSDRVSLKASSGLYHQPPQPQEAIGVGTVSDVFHETSWSSSVGWEQRINNAVHYDVDVFYRRMSDLIVYDEAWTGFGSNPFVNLGDGRAAGVEVILRHDPVGPFFGWISYTLSRSARRDSPTCGAATPPTTGGDLFGSGDCWYLFDFDQTHIASAQGSLKLPAAFEVSAQVQYVTGNPTDLYDTAVYDVDGNFHNGLSVSDNLTRLPPYAQTSIRLDRDWVFKKWRLDTYVDLMNLVRGVNSEFTTYNYDYTEVAYVRGLPFIPNIGFEVMLWP